MKEKAKGSENYLERKSSDIVIEVSDLHKSFGANHVLKGFNMKIKKGESVAIMGKSGSGKSVLIKCIIKLIRPDSGIIRVFESNVPDLNNQQMDQIRKKMGFLFQSNALYDSMDVRANLQFTLERRVGLDKSTVNFKINEALRNVGLEDAIDMMPADLSGGMRKRIALARILILEPDIMLYDEPTTGLDPVTSKEISYLMVEVQKKYNTSSAIITHDISCARIAAERIIFLLDGQCYAEGSYEELKRSDDPKIKMFFND
jgi:phospholipid/cholesterol/gamma-HCH transport system ATP-binding protein